MLYAYSMTGMVKSPSKPVEEKTQKKTGVTISCLLSFYVEIIYVSIQNVNRCFSLLWC